MTAGLSSTLKRPAAELLLAFTRWYLRSVPLRRGKRLYWERVVEPYLLWRHRRSVASTRFGHRFAVDTRDFIQRSLYYFGVWEPNLSYWMRERLAPGDHFVDVGAYIGYFSLLASAAVGEGGRVLAIEASPRLFRELEANLRRNGAANVKARNLAAWSRTGTVRLFAGPEENRGQTTTDAELGLALEAEVEARRLDEIAAEEGLGRPRLVKIDVEGAEWEVLEGMGALLEEGGEELELVVEVAPEGLARRGRTPADLVRRMEERGFRPYVLENRYDCESYLYPFELARPRRLEGEIGELTDLVFSRRDREHL